MQFDDSCDNRRGCAGSTLGGAAARGWPHGLDKRWIQIFRRAVPGRWATCRLKPSVRVQSVGSASLRGPLEVGCKHVPTLAGGSPSSCGSHWTSPEGFSVACPKMAKNGLLWLLAAVGTSLALARDGWAADHPPGSCIVRREASGRVEPSEFAEDVNDIDVEGSKPSSVGEPGGERNSRSSPICLPGSCTRPGVRCANAITGSILGGRTGAGRTIAPDNGGIDARG